MAALSTSGQHVAVVGWARGKHVLTLTDGTLKPLRSVALGDAKVRNVEWAGDGFVLVHYSSTVNLNSWFLSEKAEMGAVVVVPVDGSSAWPVFTNNSEINGGVSATYGTVERDGHIYGEFGATTVKGPEGIVDGGMPTVSADLYEVDLASRHASVIARPPDGQGRDRDWLLDAQGSVGATLDVVRTSGQWTLRNAKKDIIATGREPTGRVGLLGFSADNANVIYWARQGREDGVQWFSVPLAGGEVKPVLPDIGVAKLFLDHGHHLLGYLEEGANGQSHFFNAHQDKVYKAVRAAFPDERLQVISHSEDFNRLIVRAEGPGDPVSWGLVDIHTGKTELIGQSYALAAADVGPMRMLPYIAADGTKMEGVLTLPPGNAAKNLPAIILPHGGPFGVHDVAGFDWIAQAFASRGYAVFQPNFRGSDGYGAGFEAAGHGEWGRKMQTDISDGLAELVKQGIVDPKRVCIVGASYGGYAALAGITLQQGLYRCAVSYAGIGDVARMVEDEAYSTDYDHIMVRNLKEEIGQGRDLKAVSPMRFVDKVSVPVLLIHGTNDTVVPFAQSSRMADALRQAGKQVDFVTLQSEDHWLSRGETRLAMLQATVDFVMKHNPA
ncbi:MAG: S9 family peptidase [Sphingomonadales bacterium]|nr:S9 family peptidase [Sphingomonadales bacterium]